MSLAISGLVNVNNGVISRIPNFPHFQDVNLAEVVQSKLGHPCFIYNAARLCAVGAYLQDADLIILGGSVNQRHWLIEKMLRHHLHHMYNHPTSLQLAKNTLKSTYWARHTYQDVFC